MADISYVYPNVSGIQQRGGLVDRWQLAKELRCSYVEVPADFIKNKTEIEKTGLNLGDFLTEKAIAALYSEATNVPRKLKYIIHTEPSLARKDGYGITHQAPLKRRKGVKPTHLTKLARIDKDNSNRLREFPHQWKL